MPLETETTGALDERVRTELLPELEVLRSLGTGTSADVYLARETSLQRLVAVKVLRPSLAADDIRRRRFEREAQSAARIVHAHVTAIYRVGHLSDGVPYIVMEYVEGRTLADIIESGVGVEAGQTRALLGAIASALGAAHERGIVHRDVRPGNVLVDRAGRAVLGDFGIAGLLESGASANTRLTAAGVRLGDARYMSPEQIRGDPTVEQSDVYAFGILAFELLTGAEPFTAKGDAQLMAAHLQQEPRKVRDVRPDVDATVAAIIDSCLARDPNRRPLARDVAAKLIADRTPAEPEAERSTLELFVHELKRRRVYQVLVAYGAAALAVLGLSEAANGAGLLSSESYSRLVATVLIGFPLVLVLSWVYDIRRGGIERTRSEPLSSRMKLLVWGALAAVAGVAALVAWLMLRGGR